MLIRKPHGLSLAVMQWAQARKLLPGLGVFREQHSILNRTVETFPAFRSRDASRYRLAQGVKFTNSLRASPVFPLYLQDQRAGVGII
jgi:hypothetical protein